MFSKILLSIFLFFTSTVFAASADTCAVSHPLPIKEDGALLFTFSLAGSGNGAEGITDELYNYTQEAISTAGTAISISDISFNFTLNEAGFPQYDNGLSKHFSITQTELALSFIVIFVAPDTGEYIFTTDHVNQGAATFIFDNRDMYCCEDFNVIEWLNKTSHFYYVPEDPMYQTNSVTVHLEKGLDYLMAFTYLTRDGNPYMYTSTTLPSGQVTTNLTGYIHPTYEGIECGIGNSTSSMISDWTGSYTTTYSTTVAYNEQTAHMLGLPYTDVETIYYILTPTAVSSSSIIISSSSEVITSSSSEIITPSSSGVITSSSSEIITPSSSEISTPSSSLSENTSRTSSINSSTPADLSSDSSSSSEESLSVQSSRTSSEISSTHASSALSGPDSSVTASTNLSASITSSSITSSTGKSSMSITLTSSDSASSSDSSKNIDSTINAVSSVNSNVNGFANSSSTSHSESSSTENVSTKLTKTGSTNTALTKLTESKSTNSFSQGTRESNNVDTISMSTYTDVYGMTRTTTVRCSSTTSNDAKSDVEGDSEGTNLVTLTTNIGNNGFELVSAVTKDNTASPTNQVTGKIKEGHSTTIPAKQNPASSADVQLQFSGASTTTSINIQQAPNAANKYTVGLFISIISLTFQTFLI